MQIPRIASYISRILGCSVVSEGVVEDERFLVVPEKSATLRGLAVQEEVGINSGRLGELIDVNGTSLATSLRYHHLVECVPS